MNKRYEVVFEHDWENDTQTIKLTDNETKETIVVESEEALLQGYDDDDEAIKLLPHYIKALKEKMLDDGPGHKHILRFIIERVWTDNQRCKGYEVQAALTACRHTFYPRGSEIHPVIQLAVAGNIKGNPDYRQQTYSVYNMEEAANAYEKWLNAENDEQKKLVTDEILAMAASEIAHFIDDYVDEVGDDDDITTLVRMLRPSSFELAYKNMGFDMTNRLDELDELRRIAFALPRNMRHSG